MRVPKKTIIAILILSAIALLLDNLNRPPAPRYATVTVSGEVSMPAGPVPEGTLHFRLYNLESLSGDLAHPLEEIEDFSSDTAAFTHTFEYPLHKGEGLAIHAWLDSDGDDVFCTPDSRLDPGGLAWMEETPEGEATLNVTLSENCRAANYFYPPAP